MKIFSCWCFVLTIQKLEEDPLMYSRTNFLQQCVKDEHLIRIKNANMESDDICNGGHGVSGH